jgi:hypothetical protein
MKAAEDLAVDVGRVAACRALSVPRASLYRHTGRGEVVVPPAPRPTPARALTPVVSKNWICFRSCRLQSPLQRSWLLSRLPAPHLRPVSTQADIRRRLGLAR